MSKDKLFHRQINPAFRQGDSISSQVFKPTVKDNGLLSLYNGDTYDLDESFNHYTINLKLNSIGVASISAIEFIELAINVIDDNDPFIGHSSADFNNLSNNQSRKAAKKLKNLATKRGLRLY